MYLSCRLTHDLLNRKPFHNSRQTSPNLTLLLSSEFFYHNGAKMHYLQQTDNFDLEDRVVIYVRKSGMIDGSRTNACASALVKDGGRFDWRGPLIVLGQPGTALDPLIYRDIVPINLRLAVDYLRSYEELQVHPFKAKCA